MIRVPFIEPARSFSFYSAIFLLLLSLLSVDAVAEAALDPASAECISCHETTVNPELPGLVCHSEGCNHAIGVDYISAAGARPSLTPPAELGPDVMLVNGAIGCTTCHVSYSASDHEALSQKRADGSAPDPMLVVDNKGSALCMVCHRM